MDSVKAGVTPLEYAKSLLQHLGFEPLGTGERVPGCPGEYALTQGEGELRVHLQRWGGELREASFSAEAFADAPDGWQALLEERIRLMAAARDLAASMEHWGEQVRGLSPREEVEPSLPTLQVADGGDPYSASWDFAHELLTDDEIEFDVVLPSGAVRRYVASVGVIEVQEEVGSVERIEPPDAEESLPVERTLDDLRNRELLQEAAEYVHELLEGMDTVSGYGAYSAWAGTTLHVTFHIEQGTFNLDIPFDVIRDAGSYWRDRVEAMLRAEIDYHRKADEPVETPAQPVPALSTVVSVDIEATIARWLEDIGEPDLAERIRQREWARAMDLTASAPATLDDVLHGINQLREDSDGGRDE